MSTYSLPVSQDEIEVVKKILARMEAHGQSLSSFVQPPAISGGSMTDGSKRVHAAVEPSENLSEEEDSAFDLISEVGGCAKKGDKSAQKPMAPQISLPPMVNSLEKWGKTVCTLPKVKADDVTYYQIGTLPKYRDYCDWVFKQGESKGAKCVDLRNYLIAAGLVSEPEGVVFPGTTELRRFRDGLYPWHVLLSFFMGYLSQ